MPVSAAPPAFPGVFAMRPTRPLSGKSDLFRERLEVIIDPHHALVRLAGLVPWSHFDEAFGRFYRPIGRPAKPTRLMVGLHYLKHVHDLSDEEVVARWVENPYWQFFCGFDFFQHEVPLDASTMTRWRKRIGLPSSWPQSQRPSHTRILSPTFLNRSVSALSVVQGRLIKIWGCQNVEILRCCPITSQGQRLPIHPRQPRRTSLLPPPPARWRWLLYRPD